MSFRGEKMSQSLSSVLENDVEKNTEVENVDQIQSDSVITNEDEDNMSVKNNDRTDSDGIQENRVKDMETQKALYDKEIDMLKQKLYQLEHGLQEGFKSLTENLNNYRKEQSKLWDTINSIKNVCKIHDDYISKELNGSTNIKNADDTHKKKETSDFIGKKLSNKKFHLSKMDEFFTIPVVKINGQRLVYQNISYYPGEHIIVKQDELFFSAVFRGIENDVIWLMKSSDANKFCVHIDELKNGEISIYHEGSVEV